MTKYYEVVPQRIVHGSHGSLTYSSDLELPVGSLVTVPVGKKTDVPAVVIKSVAKPTFATREIIALIENQPMPISLVNLADWISQFYATHPVTTWQTILPRGLTRSRRKKENLMIHPERIRTQIVLNDQQQATLAAIRSQPSATAILHGITGSGKTQVYIELAKKTVGEDKSTIVLVPEIALTSQLIAEFTPHFETVIVTHSTMTEAERHTTWKSILNATEPLVIIGPRSALFSPVRDLGLIVIDESHEPTFKQEQSPRYSALRAAAKLAEFAQARLVLGSATPGIADYYLAQSSNRPILKMTRSARPNVVQPDVTVVDMTKKTHFGRHRFISTKMIDTITHALKNNHQALIFHNRRGTAPTTLCESCGWNALCPHCFVPLTLHADKFHLRCHICNLTDRVPTNCPECGRTDVIHKGIGTKLLEQELTKLFPQAKIARFDGDTHSDEKLDKQYQVLYDGDIDIIIGTQVVAKGLDLPKLRVVGVIQADAGLALPDYQSTERTFQLIYQVCGRVGRNEHPSSVIVQSYQPTHPAVSLGISRDYDGFYEYAIAERKRSNFPPFRHLAKMVCSYKTEQSAIEASRKLVRELRKAAPSRVEILGPAPAFYERVRDSYRWQITLKSPVRADLVELMQHLPPTHWQYELDPASLL